MSFVKQVLYHWLGANESLFYLLNSGSGEFYHYAMIMISRTMQGQYFPMYLMLMACCGVFSWLWRTIFRRGGANIALVRWFGVVCVAAVAYKIDSSLVNYLKEYFSYPRPYVALPTETVTLLEFRNMASQDYRSFPSGHVSMASVLVVSVWPVLTGGLSSLLVLVVPLMALSRIALGVHFPADCVYGFLLALAITVLVRWFIYALLFKLFRLKCG